MAGPYITALDVSTNPDEEQALIECSFTKIDVDLNTGTQAGNSVFLWYQKGSMVPVTRVQVTFNDKMEAGLKNYNKINKNLNAGNHGVPLYMWYSTASGQYDIPIVDVNVTTEPSGEFNHLTNKGVWEEVSCNLNLGAGGNFVYVWVKREKPCYICEVTATDNYEQDQGLFSAGYTRVDVNTNLQAGGAEVFIWYRKTTDETKSLSALSISINEQQAKALLKDGFMKVSINLNENTAGGPVYLWHQSKPNLGKVRGLVLLLNMDAVDAYKTHHVTVIERSLNTGNTGATIYMCCV